MIKISRESKVGISVVLILILFYWGFNFLKGKNLFDGALSSYRVEYENINGLTTASAVTINGYKVGKVIEIHQKEGSQKIVWVAEFVIEEEDISFTKNSVVKIYSASLMGGKSLAIIPGISGPMAEPGDRLRGEIETDMLSSFGEKLNPLQSKVENTIVHIDLLAQQLNKLLSDAAIRDIQGSLSNLNATLANLNSTSAQVDGTLKNNQKQIDQSIKNFAVTSNNLKQVSDSLSQVRFAQLSKKIDKTVTNLQHITQDIQAGKGTMGKLAKDEKLYDNLENASKELELLLREVKTHPKRFVHFSMFGKDENKSKTKTKK